MSKGNWIGYHTSPNLDPHVTIAWWPHTLDLLFEGLGVLHEIRAMGPVQAYVNSYERFGVRKDIDVAIVHDTDGILHAAAKIGEQVHHSEWPTRPHVTAHEGRQYFDLRWIGLHTPTEHRYIRLGDVPKNGR